MIDAQIHEKIEQIYKIGGGSNDWVIQLGKLSEQIKKANEEQDTRKFVELAETLTLRVRSSLARMATRLVVSNEVVNVCHVDDRRLDRRPPPQPERSPLRNSSVKPSPASCDEDG